MSNHTPGPWKVKPNTEYDRLHLICHERDGFILVARTCFAPSSEANACLIAAAPRLLEALKRCLTAMTRNGIVDRHEVIAYEEASAAIAEAEGE